MKNEKQFQLISEFSLEFKDNKNYKRAQDFITGAGTAITAVGLLSSKRLNKGFTSGLRFAGRQVKKVYNPKSSKNIVNRVGNNLSKKIKDYENVELNANPLAYTTAGVGGATYTTIDGMRARNKENKKKKL